MLYNYVQTNNSYYREKITLIEKNDPSGMMKMK